MKITLLHKLFFAYKKDLLSGLIITFFFLFTFVPGLSASDANIPYPQAVTQQRQVSGTITDETTGESIIGANVIIKGSTTGVITDLDGRFTIQASGNDILLISYIGYIPKEVAVHNQTSLAITLSEDVKALEEVVVVGYGVQKKSVVTAAISRVDANELVKNSPTDMRYALQGKVSGVQITSHSGQPGSEAIIRIRGIGTINDNTPLYLVDGFPAESNVISTLNPSDIASIEILKDAASAAIYGARAANGVVLITTKGGSKGKAKITYDFTFGMQNPWKKMDVLNAVQYQTLVNESYENA